MLINGINVDITRGFDVCLGARILRHFTNYSEAWIYAQAGRGRYLRYWATKES